MDTTLLILRPGRETEVKVVDLPLQPGSDRIDALIRPLLDGHDFLHVTVPYGDRRAELFIDGMGGCIGLPVNDAATAICRAARLARSPFANPDVLPAIYGPAVLVERLIWS